MGELFSFLIVIAVIIFIHEFGHFSMAKLFAIPVATFSLGFGPKLFGFRYKETEYKVSAIPLGGYVKIHGMEDQETAPDDPNSFYNRPRYQRFLVLFMGVGFNILLAIVLITISLMMGRQVPQSTGMESRIGIVKEGSPAEKAGLQPGDLILEMNGRDTPTWEQVVVNTLLNPNENVVVRFRRGDQVLERIVHVERKEDHSSLGYMGVSPSIQVAVLDVTKNMPAEKGGLRVNDVLKMINGKPIHERDAAVQAVKQSEGKPIEIVVERVEGSRKVTKTFNIQPEKYTDVTSSNRFTDTIRKLLGKPEQKRESRWIIGFVPGEPMILKKLPFSRALVDSFRTCKEHVRLTGLFLYKLVRGKLSLKATSGPFAIAGYSESARQTGLATFLMLIGQISFDIGLINLLPIPALDGGHLFFLVLEWILRREFSIKLKERVTMIGFAFLICVMVVVLYYDISKTGPIQKLIESFGDH